jgi:hypothetical protein
MIEPEGAVSTATEHTACWFCYAGGNWWAKAVYALVPPGIAFNAQSLLNWL